MARRFQLPRPALIVLAMIFAGATLLYNFLWLAAVQWGLPAVELGYDSSYLSAEHAQFIREVYLDSPAERAGLRTDDRIIAVNGQRLENAGTTDTLWRQAKPGDAVQLTVQRPGRAATIVLTGVFRKRVVGASKEGVAEYFAGQIRGLFPVPFVLVGLAVLILRVDDPHAWILALMFASFTASPGIANDFGSVAPVLRPFAKVYQSVFVSLLGPLFYWLFAVFPTRSALDRRAPWLKWASLPQSLLFAIPGFPSGGLRDPAPMGELLRDTAAQRVPLYHVFGFMALGLICMAHTYFHAANPEVRRKMRVIFWGTALGVLPAGVRASAIDFVHFESPWWLDTVVVLLMFLFPLSFAYAVVKHRVLEIPVLLKRSARYLLVQRGFTVLLSALSIGLTVLFALAFPRYLQGATSTDAAQPAAVALGAIFGTGLLWGGWRVHQKVSGKIDRAFFRSAYDARVILEDLAEKTRTATDSVELAHLLEGHLAEALHPSSLVVYLRRTNGDLAAATGAVPQGLERISENLPLVAELRRHARPWDFPPAGGDGASGWSTLAPLHAECLVPIPGHGGQLVGLLALGPRLSEEPYSREDKRLLASVASQAGTAVDNIRLAEEIAERMESERRTAREMEIAKEVQTRLLPQAPPRLETLECAAHCIQARSVGGDYYDFLDLGSGRAGFALADVSGKGVHAALLVANLQALLRSQSGVFPADPVRMLENVNQMLWKSTAPEHYATLFFGMYDDATRGLSYVNCGHNPPVLLRGDGTMERLKATALVIGIFERWECSVRQVQLGPGDVLAIFSDGVTEAMRGEEEFGEERFIDELRLRWRLPVSEMVGAILGSVQEFSEGTQSDDLTLVIVRGCGGE
ncbi:MAG TPA: SpoIIE family protein phosphatase [Bryobacteraceae bacterium]|nr:SpoIIE family protein phosphatase [Bryobacteraceae bacterium]